MTPSYAVIHVKPTPTSDAWPVVERVEAILGGGWQSGAHHYRDADVLDVRPLTLVDPGDTRSTQVKAAETMLEHWIDLTDADVDGHTACVCRQWREGGQDGPSWDDHLAEVLANAGLLVADPTPADPFSWRTQGCTVAGRSIDEVCGERVHGAVLVHAYALPLSDGIAQPPRPSGLLVCRRHWDGLTGAPDVDRVTEGGCACSAGDDGVQRPDTTGQLACDDGPAPGGGR